MIVCEYNGGECLVFYLEKNAERSLKKRFAMDAQVKTLLVICNHVFDHFFFSP